MPCVLKENEGIPKLLLIIMALATGFSVANCYYNQSLLGSIVSDFHASEYDGSIISALTQFGYVVGLCIVIPLGNTLSKKRIITIDYFCCSMALLSVAITKDLFIIKLSSFIIGISSVMPQFFIPMAALYSEPKNKALNIGIIQSCLLIGILGSRFLSGIISEAISWRYVYFFASVVMLLCLIAIAITLPGDKTLPTSNYRGTLKSMISLLRHNKTLHTSAARSATAYASFFALWSCISYRMKASPFFASDDVIGSLGLCGIAGASCVIILSKHTQTWGSRRCSIAGALSMLFAWFTALAFDGYFVSIVITVLIIDAGMQCIHLSNQTKVVTSSNVNANFLNTLYMILYFVGGTIGTLIAGILWTKYQWNGTIIIGILFTLISLFISILTTD